MDLAATALKVVMDWDSRLTASNTVNMVASLRSAAPDIISDGARSLRAGASSNRNGRSSGAVSNASFHPRM